MHNGMYLEVPLTFFGQTYDGMNVDLLQLVCGFSQNSC